MWGKGGGGCRGFEGVRWGWGRGRGGGVWKGLCREKEGLRRLIVKKRGLLGEGKLVGGFVMSKIGVK